MQEILKWFIRLVRYDMKTVQNETALPQRKRTDKGNENKENKEKK